jgi:hypothetical protein
MRSVLETCQPRPEILAGTFNPEVFTASLSPIIQFYRTGRTTIDSIYTKAEQFFKEATFPTQGLRQILTEIFARIQGDMSVPATHRLETAFGGGKTHTLIACTHIAYRGSELQDALRDILPSQLLPEPGTVSVVGVAGDEIPVHKTKGSELVPYTLWGEIAYQVGGEALYREVEDDANSYAAPGKPYFDKVFKDRKVLIMLDELAQYAARLEAARHDGANQLAAFLMTLHGYARNNPGIAIVLTLASASDAFNKQTKQLAQLISKVKGEAVSEDDALTIGEQAVKGVTSVVARDAVQITPVQAAEISSVFSKRLFVSIDREAAKLTADEYAQMYRRNSSLLPDEAVSDHFLQRMVANYPFHPTLIDFLNRKLASAENFQGTRGVLRVLSLAVRSLWKNKQAVPMIHICHLDMRSDRVVNEILGRTGGNDLMYVLNADVGSVDTGTMEGGRSNAELADLNNPHPAGFPLYEYTWKTVFLHSLVGREEGLNSNVFGVTESEALFDVAFPGLTPPQVRTALEEITESAFYLRFDQGRYFASEEPTINSILARIRRTVTSNQIHKLIEATARKLISSHSDLFHIEHDVSLPEHLPDGKGRPILGVVSPMAEKIHIEKMITTKGENKPRIEQNLIFVLVPESVSVEGITEEQDLFQAQASKVESAKQYVEMIARQVMAMRMLMENPQNYGVTPRRLEESDFKIRKSEREQALSTVVSELYSGVYFPSTSGHIVRKEIKTAGGEGGVSFIEQIREILINDGELITSNHNAQSDLINLSQLFFGMGDPVLLDNIRANFRCSRRWPVLEKPEVLDILVRVGIQKGAWCVFKINEGESSPVEFYDKDQDIPMSVNLNEKGYFLITPQGANQRGWTTQNKVDPEQIRQSILQTLGTKGLTDVEMVAKEIKAQYGDLPDHAIKDTLAQLIREERLYAYRGSIDQPDKPNLLKGHQAVLYIPQSKDVLVSPTEARRRGWLEEETDRSFRLDGQEGTDKLLSMLRRVGSLYNRGASSTIDYLEYTELHLPHGGTISIRLQNVSPESMKTLSELFEVLDGITTRGEDTEVYLEVNQPDNGCLFIQELQK